MNVNDIPAGWWLQVSPLAKIDPDEWIVAVLKRGKKSWITETCKSGFDTYAAAYQWGVDYIVEELIEQQWNK